MNPNKPAGTCLVLGFLLAAVLSAGASGLKDPPKPPPGEEAPPEASPAPAERVQVYGLVRLVGSGVRPEAVISADDGEWYINRSEQDPFIKLQQQWVHAEGAAGFWDMILANGVSLGTRRILRDIRLLEDAPNPK